MRDAEKTIGNLIDKQRLAYIGAVDEEGYPVIKAMLAPRRRAGIGEIYFSTNTSSRHVAQFRAQPKACAYFCDARFYRGALLQGTMQVLEDAQSKRMIWQEGDTLYYPQGVDDSDYCVLHFTAKRGRFYSNFHSDDFAIPAPETL
nr:pyridoxamine 5'-phosphate oxidase family protein [Maliibacterium massiliense]